MNKYDKITDCPMTMKDGNPKIPNKITVKQNLL